MAFEVEVDDMLRAHQMSEALRLGESVVAVVELGGGLGDVRHASEGRRVTQFFFLFDLSNQLN